MTDGQEYESELTKMAEGSTEKGVNEVSAGEKNLDSEFKKKSTTPSHGGTAKSGSKTKKSSKKSGKKSSKSKKKKSKKKGRK